MDRVSIGPVKGLKIAITAFVLSVVLFLVVVVGAVLLLIVRNNDEQDFSKELRSGLVKNCERNGNPLREAVRGQIESQIAEREHLQTFLPPGTPPMKLERLIAKQNAVDRATAKKLAPVDCGRLYPLP